MRSPRLAPRATGLTILAIGLSLIAFALLADVLGFGGGRGFGYQQMIVFIVGMVMVLGGGALLLQIGNSDTSGNSYQPDKDSSTGF